MSNQNNSKSENEKDKTVMFNSGSERKNPSEDDKTRVEQSEPKNAEAESKNDASSGAGSSAPKNDASQKAAGPTPNDLKNAKSSDKGSVSAGAFAAGVAGAAAAGVAAGTIYSEEIKEVFTAQTFDAPESPEEEIQDATEQAVSSDESTDDVQFVDNPSEAEAMAESVASEFTYQFSDEGGVYEVSMVDMDSDGELDSLTADAQLVDGSSISFTAAGDTLHAFFSDTQFEVAEPVDYLSYCGGETFENFGPESLGAESYSIQYGDTLSEIAAAHNTSIVDLMALNPQITDANVISAGDDILIPLGDSDSNPYAGWTPNEPEIGIEFGEEVFMTEDYNSSSEYIEMDWQSFEDEPLDEYASTLGETDFYSMETPESYLDFGNDLDSLDFL
jgi:LysM repeat protein